MVNHALRIVAISLCLGTASAAAEHFVAPDGKPDGVGSSDSPWDIASVLAGRQPIEPGDTVWLRGGTYRCEEAYKTNGQGFQVTLSGSAEKPIVLRACLGERATIDGGMVVRGDNLWLWDIEIAQPDDLPRVVQESGSHPDLGNPSGGLTIHGSDCRLINLLIQNNLGNGVGWWSSARGGEIYGCIIADNGWKGPDRNHGHSIYTQNREGTKTISNCILTTRWPGGHYTMHAYGSSRAHVDHYLIEENIAWRHGTFLVGGGRPSLDITVRRNWLHQVPMQIGYNAPHNEDCRIVENRIYRAGLSVNNFKKGEVCNNLIVHGGLSVRGEGLVENDANRLIHDRAPDDDPPILLPNKYDSKRANLALFNPTGRSRIQVPRSDFLGEGERFRLVDPLAFHGKPVFEGTCGRDGFTAPVDGECAVYVVLKD